MKTQEKPLRWVGGTYRSVYTVSFPEAVFVLHCFQKKSKRGIATPKAEMALVHARLKVAQHMAEQLRIQESNDANTHH